MKTLSKGLTLAVFISALSACGSDPAPGPTEQIVVREPGTTIEEPVVGPLAAAANPDAALIAEGEAAFGTCMTCHRVDKDGGNLIGPNLHGVIGRKAGAMDGFKYSAAMASSGITWTKEELDSYLADPAAKVPGTTMMAGAIKDAGKRTAIIAYIEDASKN